VVLKLSEVKMPRGKLFAKNSIENSARTLATVAVILALPALAGCGGHAGAFDVEDPGSTKMNNLVALVRFQPLPRQPRPTDDIKCPEILVLDGGAADRVYVNTSAEQTNSNVRYQFRVDDVARDCQADGNQISMKIGVSGRVLLGPAGAPGNFTAPVRLVIVRETDQSAVVTKLYQVPGSVPAGQTGGMFTLVTDPITVPASSAVNDYTIKVGFDVPADKRPKGAPASPIQQAAARVPNSPGEHHHHRHRDQTQ
jgi:hypothetical protein